MAPRKSPNPSKTASYYNSHPEAKKKKDAYNKEFNKRKSQRKKRSELTTERRKRGIAGKGGKDLHHGKNGKLVAMSPSKNRGMKEKSRLKGSKRK